MMCIVTTMSETIIDSDGWAILHQFGLWTIKQHPTEKDNLVVSGAVFGKRDIKRGGDYEYWWDINRCNEKYSWEDHLDEKDWWDDVRTESGPQHIWGYNKDIKDITKSHPNKKSDFIKCFAKAKEIISL